ncbi:MAG: single-stranded DNA-binding protein [Bacilli bacterium]
MNKVILIGRLTAKPELKYSNTNIPYARFTVAVNRNFTGTDGKREADFIGVIVWRKQAENLCNYLNKGSQVALDGHIQTGSYTDKEGNKKYTTDIVAENVTFLDSKSQTKGSDTTTPYDFQKPTNDINVNGDPFADFGDSVAIDDNFLD